MTREEAIQKLLEEDKEFKHMYEEHKELEWQISKLENIFHLTQSLKQKKKD